MLCLLCPALRFFTYKFLFGFLFFSTSDWQFCSSCFATPDVFIIPRPFPNWSEIHRSPWHKAGNNSLIQEIAGTRSYRRLLWRRTELPRLFKVFQAKSHAAEGEDSVPPASSWAVPSSLYPLSCCRTRGALWMLPEPAMVVLQDAPKPCGGHNFLYFS